jgi:hypothetical protein
MSLIGMKAAFKAVAKPVSNHVTEIKDDYKANKGVVTEETVEDKCKRYATRLAEAAHDGKRAAQPFLDAAIVKLNERLIKEESDKLKAEAEDVAAAQRIVDAAVVKRAEEMAKKDPTPSTPPTPVVDTAQLAGFSTPSS